MKNIVNILFGTLLILSCAESKVEHEQQLKNSTEKLNIPITPQARPIDIEGEIKYRLDSLYKRVNAKCNFVSEAVTQFNGKKEFWTICNSPDLQKIVKIKSHNSDQLFEEVYFTKAGELIYAEESINYTPINHFIQQVWRCHFYFDNERLVTLSSLGHGKTEEENWDPVSILSMYQRRKAELNRIIH